MIGFFLNLWRLTCAVVHALRTDQDFRGLLVLMLVLLAGATCFYAKTEGWSVIDSLYFSVMTMSTIGYGDLGPTTSLSKTFTIVFSILSIGVFAAVASKIVVAIVNRRHLKENKRRQKADLDDSRN